MNSPENIRNHILAQVQSDNLLGPFCKSFWWKFVGTFIDTQMSYEVFEEIRQKTLFATYHTGLLQSANNIYAEMRKNEQT